MSVLLLQTGGTDNLLLMDAGNLLLQSSGVAAGGPWPFFMDEMSAGMQTYGMAS